MFSLQRLFGREDFFFDLLEASALESKTSVEALDRFLKNPDQLRTLDEFVLARRNEKRIAEKISEAVCTTFVTALEREDIEALSVALYKIPKTVEKAAERILVAPHLIAGADLSKHLLMMESATATVLEMIKGLRKGMDLEATSQANAKLQVLESEADNMMLGLLKDLYTNHKDPVKVIFLKDLYELAEKVFDRCRDAGNVITHIVLKNS